MKTIHLRKLTAIMEVKGRTLFSKNLIIMPAFSLAFTYLIKMIYTEIWTSALTQAAMHCPWVY